MFALPPPLIKAGSTTHQGRAITPRANLEQLGSATLLVTEVMVKKLSSSLPLQPVAVYVRCYVLPTPGSRNACDA